MSRWETRTNHSDRKSFGRLGAMLQRAGRLVGERRQEGHHRDIFEHLENRVLLAGDHPSFNEIFNTPSPLLATEITLNIGGAGFAGGTINPSMDNDVFFFTAPGNDFVRVWADTIATASTLDSRVEIYRRQGANNVPVPIASGSHNNGGDGTNLTGGNFRDGWAGFIAEEGAEYFIVVSSDRASGFGSVGEYVLRVNTRSVVVNLDPFSGTNVLEGDITMRGADRVYRVRGGEDPKFNSLITVTGVADPADLNTRIDIYGANGVWITGDSDTGNISDAFAVLRGRARQADGSDTFFVRIRSDDFGDPLSRPSTGEYELRINGTALPVTIDPVTRRGQSQVQFVSDPTDSSLLRFRAHGTGLTFITINVGFPGALPDSAVRLYEIQPYGEGDGDLQRRVPLAGFNELPGPFSRLILPLVGGNDYFIVVENFDGSPGGTAYIAEFEAHHTFNASQPLDDHISTPTPPDGFDPADPEVRRQFQQATPIVWGEPIPAQRPHLPGSSQPLPYPPWPGPPMYPPSGPGIPPYEMPLDLEEDRSWIQVGRATGRIHGAQDRDLFQFVPPVDMLGEFGGMTWSQDAAFWPLLPPVPPSEEPVALPAHPFAGSIPEIELWHPSYRPSTRLQIMVQGGTMFNARIRVFDSNFNVVYDYNNNVLTGDYSGDPAGMLDPASFPPEMHPLVYGYTFAGDQPAGIEVWGGEVYYLEVLSQSGSGRYEVELQVDAREDDPAISRYYKGYAGPGEWDSAYELWIDSNSGSARNFNNVAQAGPPVEAPPMSGWWTGSSPTNSPLLARASAMNFLYPPVDEYGPGAGARTDPNQFRGAPGSRGRTLLQMSDLGTIMHPLDAHLFQFRALYDGFAEVRINTTDLLDGFWHGSVETEDGNPLTPPVSERLAVKTKVYQSPLHSALRIFNNDLEQVAFNTGNGVTAGEFDTMMFSDIGVRSFQPRDARVVFQVESGKNYFIQVESGQRDNFTLTFPKVDWRHAIGSYELLVNSMSNLNFDDDHVNFTNTLTPNATPIPIDLNNPSTTAILGSVEGEIRNTVNNPNDSDVFMFAAPGRGIANITVATPIGAPFARTVLVYDQTGTLRGFAAGSTAAISVELEAARGQRFWVVVQADGEGPTGAQGRYEVRVSGIPFIDDHASLPSFSRATEIPRDDYDFARNPLVGGGTTSRIGSIEEIGDSDIFSFETLAFDVATIVVEGLQSTMIPQIRVYEVSVDPVGNPILLLIGHRTPATGTSTSVAFSVTAPDRRHIPTQEVYNTYFVVVSGQDPNAHFGQYRLTLNVNVTVDDHPDVGQWEWARELNPGAAGTWNHSGIIEIIGDTDIFQFTAESRGTATISITSPEGSLLLPRVRIFDDQFNPVVNRFNELFVTGGDQPVSTASFSFTAQRDRTYYIAVEGAPSFGHTHKTEQTGAYTVHLDALIADDHANEFEWDIATEIIISRFTGKGLETGELEIPLDTDLFVFTTLVDGNMPIRITVPNMAFRPFLRLFDGDQNEIGFAVRDGGLGDEAGGSNPDGVVQRTLTNMVAGQVYYILVSSDQTEPDRTGAYSIFLDGPTPPRGDDDHANAGEWNEATYLGAPGPNIIRPLSPGDGQAIATGRIDYLGDNDLFFFTSLTGSIGRPAPAQVHIVTPSGSILNLKVTIFGPNQQEIISDSVGLAGVNAGVDFAVTGTNQKYWILVEHLDEELGEYTVYVDTTPAVFNLYFPEGYASDTIREYVSVVNPNAYDVNYTIRLRYEGEQPETVLLSNVVIPANSRSGLTLSDAMNGRAPGVLAATPYSIIIEADGFLGASLSHYDSYGQGGADRGGTLGESFTRRTSDTWTFARGNRWPGAVREFLLYYNPNPTPASVTLTAYKADGTVFTQTHIVEGLRRGGWNFNATPQLGIGEFSFVITSEALNPGDAHVGIVASLSHYDDDRSSGYAIFGDPNGGALAGVLPGIANGPNDFTRVTLFNPTDTSATVTLNGRYTNTNLPDLVRVITLAPRTRMTMDGLQLGMVANQTMGLRWTSSEPIAVLSTTRRAGDADATVSGTEAARAWYFGDGFINRIHAGRLYFEDLFIYNPHNQPIDVTLNFYNAYGEVTSTMVSVAAGDFGKIALHDLQAAMPRVFNWFGMEAMSDLPFVASMTHYDLVLGGGWGSAGSPMGLMTPISRIV
jgi:hypothetical protein